MPDEVRAAQIGKVRQLFAMLDGAACRPQAVRRYFGETDAGPCGVCDLCADPPRTYDALVPAQKALAAVQRLGERFGRGRVIDHLTGRTREVQPWETALSTWAVGADLSVTAWRDVIDHLMFEGLLVEDPNEGKPLIRLGDPERVRAVYRGETEVRVREPVVRAATERPRRNAGRNLAVEGLDADVRARFEALRAWRRDRAAEQHVPPYVIFQDRTLVEIALSQPRTLDALAHISGVGAGKLERYGKAVLEVLAAGSDDEGRPSDMVDKARDLRRAMSPPEILLWSRLRSQQLDGLKFRRQHPVEPYILDFYCAERRLAVEIDGDAHLHRGPQDERRDKALAAQKIRTLRIPAADVFADIDDVLERIALTARG